MIRRCTLVDIADMLAIAKSCYPPFDETKAVEWAQSAMFDPSYGLFRDDDSWGAARVFTTWWEDRPRATSMFLTGRDGQAWQACKVLRAMIEWSRQRGAVSFAFGEETGMRMEALAKRVGASRDRPSFKLTLAPAPASLQRSAA